MINIKQLLDRRLIYKLPSRILRNAKWKLDLPLETAMEEYPDFIVALGSSQALRFIDEINQQEDVSEAIKHIKRRIRNIRKQPRTRGTKIALTNLYRQITQLQFQPDYLCLVMDRMSDYDRANRGFSVNGITYRRLLGTNGGIKNSTIVYVNENIYPELKRRMDNGRDLEKKLVPAKLEAYQALMCSASTPIPQPEGVIVVNDCITHFRENVIMINDECEGEPSLTYEKDVEIEHNDSDGYGLMSPAYSCKVNNYLTGTDEPLSGMNTRWAWNKGMLYTFDFVAFAEEISHSYEIMDAWGDKRDVRKADIILTTSMLKLWDSYKNWEDYYENCQKNNYLFATTKAAPESLENVRNTNYQFLQSYTLTDEELYKLCEPTISEIKDVISMDYRKSLLFLGGFGMTEKRFFSGDYDSTTKALAIEPRLINDPYIRRKIWNMIRKRVDMGKRGAIQIDGNYAMIAGDPFALCQSMFGLEVTGLLKAGEIYHKYWIDKGSDEVACFRAPMTCHNNIRKMKLCKTPEAAHWYKYIKTALIYNAWDSACDAMNGADKDGDTNMVTDNPILVKNTLNSLTIMCVQRKAEKKLVTEEDIITANKLAFNDDIGTVTNYVTAMIERQAAFSPDSEEYQTLAYRIMCGQLYQQNTIDRAKGIISKPMPDDWHDIRKCIPHEDDTLEETAKKLFNMKLVASTKPYFMTYIYPTLKAENNAYIKNNNDGAVRRFFDHGINSLEDLYNYEPKTPEMQAYLEYYEKYLPTGNNSCVVNRMSWIFENEFDSYLSKKLPQPDFDYRIMKSNVGYSMRAYREVKEVFVSYQHNLDSFQRSFRKNKIDKDTYETHKQLFLQRFRRKCQEICTNDKELCDIVLDLCYQDSRSKWFAWDICEETIIDNLLEKNKCIHLPVETENGDFEYCGRRFQMQAFDIEEEAADESIE